jgi:hypothetical protein
MVKHMRTCEPLKVAPMSALTLGRDPLDMATQLGLVWEVKVSQLETGQGSDDGASDDG